MAETITFDPRFNGPPASANGGYACGRLAAFVDAPVAEVTLRLPPPLGRPLPVERRDDGYTVLTDDGAVVAEARPANLAAEAPAPVDAAAAERAALGSAFAEASHHPFPTCFVCGPAREPADGLGIMAGPVAGRDLYATPWTPDPEFADESGALPAELVWAALDCPSSAPIWNDPADPDFRPVVLGRLTARIVGPVMAGERHTVISWPIEIAGRRRTAGSALHTEAGELVAVSRALWIELRPAVS